MVSSKRVCFLIFLVVFSIGCGPVQKAANLSTIGYADELIDKYCAAVGGYDNLKAVQTKIIEGHYIEPGYNLLLKAHMEYKRPYYRWIGDTARGYAEGFDGRSWEYNKKKGFYRSAGEAGKATKRGAEFDESFIDYKSNGYGVEYKGIVSLNSENFHQLTLLYPDGDVKMYYFDLKTFLPRYMTKTMPLHAVGQPIDYLVTITDYRRVGKLLYPFSKIERDIKTGKMVNCTMIDTIIINREIPIDRFSPVIEE